MTKKGKAGYITWTAYRDAITGRWCTAAYAKKNPRTTVAETVSRLRPSR